MRIVIAEDDKYQREQFARILGQVFLEADITLFRTEKEFREGLEKITMETPDIVILDIMLRWTDPSLDGDTMPPDVKAGKFFGAGFRCQGLLERGDRTRDIPVILYSVLERTDIEGELAGLPTNVRFVPKAVTLYNLIAAIREMTGDAKRRNTQGHDVEN